MVKNLILIILGLFISTFSFSQCFVEVADTLICNPNEISLSVTTDEYFWEQLNSYEIENIEFDLEDLSKSPILSIGDDQIIGPFPIGFTFNFFNNNYDQFWISSNGFISFLPGAYDGYNVWTIPDLEGPYSCIFGVWEDLNPGVGGEIRQVSVGGKLIVDFKNIPSYNCGGGVDTSASFQIVLNQGTNIIEIHTANKYDCTISTQGIQDPSGVFAFTPQGRNAENWSLIDDAVMFMPQSMASVSWYNNNGQLIGEGVPLIIDAEETQNVSVLIDDGDGCVDSDTFNLQVALPSPVITQSGDVLLCDLIDFDYQWYLGGELIEGENGQFISPNEIGVYMVEIIDKNGCIQQSDPFIYDANSLLEYLDLGINFFYNQSDKGLHCTVLGSGYLKLFNLQGQNVFSQKIIEKKIININLSSGIYIAHYIDDFLGIESVEKVILY